MRSPERMQKITWTENFSVGVPVLDAQHKRFILMVNGLADNCQTKADLAIVANVLSRMKSYSNEHFSMEERLMRQYQFPGVEEHKNEHQTFLRKLMDYCIVVTFHIDIEPRKLMLYLHDWWHNHILQEDMKYKPYLAGKPVRQFLATFSPEQSRSNE